MSWMFFKFHMWIYTHVWVIRANMEFTRYNGRQLDTLRCNFLIQTLIKEILGSLEGLSVYTYKLFGPKKYRLNPSKFLQSFLDSFDPKYTNTDMPLKSHLQDKSSSISTQNAQNTLAKIKARLTYKFKKSNSESYFITKLKEIKQLKTESMWDFS